MMVQFRKTVPALVCAGAVGLIILLQAILQDNEGLDFVQRLEWMTYDWRVRLATNQPGAISTNLGFVSINDNTIRQAASGRLGYRVGLYWPRFIYGHLVQELDTQGAEAIALDVLFPDDRRFDQEIGRAHV